MTLDILSWKSDWSFSVFWMIWVPSLMSVSFWDSL